MGFWRQFKKTKGQIAFQDDIVIRAHELRPRFTEWQFNVMMNFIIPQIRMKIKDPNQLSIKCGQLGIFHFRANYAKKKMQAYKSYISKNPTASRRFKERVALIDKQADNFFKKFEVIKANARRYVISAHISPRFFATGIYGRKMSLEQIENYMKNLDETRRNFN
jgi:hypothetical protein